LYFVGIARYTGPLSIITYLLEKDNMAKIEETIIDIGKDVLVSLVILAIILGSLYAFSGRWPPMVVIESGSMMHSEESQIGVIDPGDIVLVQERDKDDITTYIEGRATGYRKYGQYGDVIIFEPDGETRETPIIHRAVLYLEYDDEDDVYNIPALGDLDYEEDWDINSPILQDVEDGEGLRGELRIYDYGHEDKTITISLEDKESSGFITKGDNNRNIDQDTGESIEKPVKEEWILGRARGELPWFGVIKLSYIGRTEYIPRNSWINFMISLGIIFLLPVIIELGSNIYDNLVLNEEADEQDKGTLKETANSGENEGSTNSKIEQSDREGEHLKSIEEKESKNDDPKS